MYIELVQKLVSHGCLKYAIQKLYHQVMVIHLVQVFLLLVSWLLIVSFSLIVLPILNVVTDEWKVVAHEIGHGFGIKKKNIPVNGLSLTYYSRCYS